MRFPRRRFLGTSLVALGGGLLEALATPLWKWNRSLILEAAQAPKKAGAHSAAGSGAAAGSGGLQFVDVAKEAGLTVPNVWGDVDRKRYIIEAKGSGLAFFDYDNDGWLDIYLTNGTRFEPDWKPGEEPTSHLYKNNRDGTFTDVTAKSGLARTGWQTGVCVGDYDNDGWDDLFCCFWGHNILFRNNGDGTFADVTKRAGLYREETRWGSGCTWIDYDRDSHLDLFVCNYIKLDPEETPVKHGEPAQCQWKGIPTMCGPRGLPGDTNILYHNNGDGTFIDVTEKAGILKPGPRFSITAVSYDFDNDGWPDIYVANDSTASALYQNRKNGTFSDVAMEAGCALSADGKPQAGMGVSAADYDLDGNLDIVKTNFAGDTPSLYHGIGGGNFEDATFFGGLGKHTQYLGWGCGFFDMDNDGWPDILICNGHVYPEVEQLRTEAGYPQQKILYRNLRNGHFEDVSSQGGTGIMVPVASRGAAFGDFDNDGDIDVVVNTINDFPQLLRCDSRVENNWLKVKTIGTKSNRSGIGARLRCVTHPPGETKPHSQIDEVRSGGSYISQNDLRIHFGIGKAEKVELLEIRWPSGSVDALKDVKPNQLIVVKEGAGIVRAVKFEKTTAAKPAK
jgi:enediyne biosynthesis protein E4